MSRLLVPAEQTFNEDTGGRTEDDTSRDEVKPKREVAQQFDECYSSELDGNRLVESTHEDALINIKQEKNELSYESDKNKQSSYFEDSNAYKDCAIKFEGADSIDGVPMVDNRLAGSYEESEVKKEFHQLQDDSSQDGETISAARRKKRRSRWAPESETIPTPPPPVGPVGVVAPIVLGATPVALPNAPAINVPGMKGTLISQLSRADPALLQYAIKNFGSTQLSEEDWKKAEDHYKINLLYQDVLKKRRELEKLQAAGKFKYEYDSDEETEGGTWEHKLRVKEMVATQLWADELTEAAKGKHHIGDFLPPEELSRFMEKYEALKQGRPPDLSDYKEYKLKEDNIGFQMLQKLGWTEGQGLGSDGTGIVDPVNKATVRSDNQGLGVERPDDVSAGDDEYDAYRKRMMLAYRFRPNPLNNPRRPYY